MSTMSGSELMEILISVPPPFGGGQHFCNFSEVMRVRRMDLWGKCQEKKIKVHP